MNNNLDQSIFDADDIMAKIARQLLQIKSVCLKNLRFRLINIVLLISLFLLLIFVRLKFLIFFLNLYKQFQALKSKSPEDDYFFTYKKIEELYEKFEVSVIVFNLFFF